MLARAQTVPFASALCLMLCWGCSSRMAPAPRASDSTAASAPGAKSEASPSSQDGAAQSTERRKRSAASGDATKRGTRAARPRLAQEAPSAPSTADNDDSELSLSQARDLLQRENKRLTGMLEDGAQKLAKASACFDACRAVASMTRATRAICELADDDDVSCDDAKATLRGARNRVRDSGCTCKAN